MKKLNSKNCLMIIITVLILTSLGIGLIIFFNVPPDYTLLSELPADLVHNCQQISKVTQVEWGLLAVYFHNTKNIPSLTNILQVGETLNEHKGDGYPYLVKDKDLWKKIKKEAENIKNISYFFSPQYIFPLGYYTTHIEDTFGADRDQGRRKHEGIDIFAPEKTPIYSVCSGKIERLGWNTLGGERVGIRDKKGFYYYYAHLEGYAKGLKEGVKVETEDLLGYVGHTGNAENTPDHLHFGIQTPQGQWINPFNFLIYWAKYTTN